MKGFQKRSPGGNRKKQRERPSLQAERNRKGRQEGWSIGSHWQSGGEPPGRDGLWFTGKNALTFREGRGHGVRRVGQRMMVAGHEAAGGKENARVGAQNGCMRMCERAYMRRLESLQLPIRELGCMVWGNAYYQINTLGSWHIISWRPLPVPQSPFVGAGTC